MGSGLQPAARADEGGECVVAVSGDLIEEVGTIMAQMPGPGSNGMVVPTASQMADWEQMLRAVLQGDLEAACDSLMTHGFPYQILRYADQGADGRAYLMLKENTPVSVGWGTYVVNPDPDAGEIVLEVPHPGCEWRTEEEGIGLLRQLNARAVLLAGTHRCANSSYSGCSGTTTFCGQEEPFRSSDVAHTTASMFHASHRALVEPGAVTVAVQLHGCTDGSCPDLFVSNTTCTPGGLSTRFSRYATAACADLVVDLADCSPGECTLVGRTNVQGRYSNGLFYRPDFEPCTEAPFGPAEQEQFLHLEQSKRLREDYACLATSLNMLLADLHERYLPVVQSAAIQDAEVMRVEAAPMGHGSLGAIETVQVR